MNEGRWAFLYFDVQVFQPWQECRELAAKLLRWLRPGGHLFFRESCFHASGAARVAGGIFFLWFFGGQMGRSSKRDVQHHLRHVYLFLAFGW